MQERRVWNAAWAKPTMAMRKGRAWAWDGMSRALVMHNAKKKERPEQRVQRGKRKEEPRCRVGKGDASRRMLPETMKRMPAGDGRDSLKASVMGATSRLTCVVVIRMNAVSIRIRSGS
jgi:hypothetical protein